MESGPQGEGKFLSSSQIDRGRYPHARFSPTLMRAPMCAREERTDSMADPTPKPIELVQGHRTKAEKRQRAKELMTSMAFKEWPEVRANSVAHKQFARLRRLYRSIDKDDAIFETVLNRYCMMLAECADYEKEYQRLYELAEKLEDNMSEMEFADYIKAVIEINKQLQANDKLLQFEFLEALSR